MAIDLNKIKEKLNKLSNQGQQQKDDIWSPDDNTTTQVRIIPWPDGNGGDPLKERWFYYGVGKGRSIICPFQFGKPDPINELREKLREEGTKESFALRDSLRPSRRFFAPVVIRDKEDEGVKIWGFSKTVAKYLYDEMMDEDVGDITDPKTGFDIKVTKQKNDGQTFASVTVKTNRKPSPLMDDSKAAAELLKNVPDLNEIYPEIGYDEIEKRLNDFINAEEQLEDEGTEKKFNNPSARTDKVTDEESSSIDSTFDDLEDLIES